MPLHLFELTAIRREWEKKEGIYHRDGSAIDNSLPKAAAGAAGALESKTPKQVSPTTPTFADSASPTAAHETLTGCGWDSFVRGLDCSEEQTRALAVKQKELRAVLNEQARAEASDPLR